MCRNTKGNYFSGKGRRRERRKKNRRGGRRKEEKKGEKGEKGEKEKDRVCPQQVPEEQQTQQPQEQEVEENLSVEIGDKKSNKNNKTPPPFLVVLFLFVLTSFHFSPFPRSPRRSPPHFISNCPEMSIHQDLSIFFCLLIPSGVDKDLEEKMSYRHLQYLPTKHNNKKKHILIPLGPLHGPRKNSFLSLSLLP